MSVPLARRRAEKWVDEDLMLDMCLKGFTQSEIADELGVSVPTLAKRIARIQSEQGILLQYRSLQGLQLTSLQARILEAITPEKIANASLSELVAAFKILKEKELVIDGKPTEIKGILGYLIQLEKQEAAMDEPIDITELSKAYDMSGKITDTDAIPLHLLEDHEECF
jgi:DNA-binding Lrp family transcriptional regulator